MSQDELRTFLEGKHPRMDAAGRFRVEVTTGPRKCRVRWATLAEAARLCTLHPGLVAFMCVAPTLAGASADESSRDREPE